MRTWILLSAIIVLAVLALACAQTDTVITTKVKTKMAMDDVVRGQDIEVTTNEGVVTLKGNINSEDEKQRALSIARDTEGVTEVKDMIAVRTASGEGDAPDTGRRIGIAIDDTGITMRVKGRLIEDPTVKGLKIDVDTRDGTVYLTGEVLSEQEMEQAIKLARETEGVKDVQANLTIGNK